MIKLIFCILLSIMGFAYAQSPFKVLVFTKTAGFQHASIPDGIAAINILGQQNNFTVEDTDDATVFNSGNLSQYSAVIFLNTTGDVLNSSEETAFEQYIQAGGGFVGIHSASDTEYNWPWYGGLVGRYFQNHPAVQDATVHVIDPNHPSTQALNTPWLHNDEWYNFATPFPSHLNVLLTVDENTYTGGTMGAFHPVSWYHFYDGGRSFYTALGHTSAAYSDPQFREHLLGAILWAADEITSANEIENIKKNFRIFPSPANELFYIHTDIKENFPVILKIFNLKSELVLEKTLVQNSGINVENLMPGIYFVQLLNEHLSQLQKFLIIH